jgi:hypothetical protein
MNKVKEGQGIVGIRPIAIGEFMRRLTSKVAISQNKDAIKAHFGSLQVGVGVKNGAEAAVHAVAQVVKEFGHDGSLGCLKLDFQNAFNCIDRALMLEQVRLNFPSLYKWFELLYADHSVLYYDGENTIPSAAGTQQGGPEAPFGFALALHVLVLRIRERFPELKLQIWYLDDGSFVGTHETLRRILQFIMEEGPAMGLFLNLRKSELWWPTINLLEYAQYPDELIKSQATGMVLLGAPIGDREFCEEELLKRVFKIEKVLDVSALLNNPQMELQLLHGCFAPSMLSYALRTCPPEYSHAATEKFDLVMRQTIGRIQGAPLTAEANLQRTLRVDDEGGMCGGGLGIPFAKDMSPVCFAASTHSTSQLQADIFGDHFLGILPRDNSVAKTLLLEKMNQEELEAALNAANVQSALSRNVSRYNAEVLKTKLASHDGDAWKKKAALIQVARFNSLQLPKCGSWVYALPVVGTKLSMSSAAFKIALQLRHGSPIFEKDSCCSKCGKNMDVYGMHALHCNTGTATISYRHNMIRDFWFHAARKSGRMAPKREEPGLLGENDGRRPGDLWMENYFGGAQAFDFVVTNPCCDSNYVAASECTGSAGAKAYQAKLDKSLEPCRQEGFGFTPVALEAFGGWNLDSLKEMKKFASVCVPLRAELEDVAKAKARVFQQFSVLFQKLTAEMILVRL